MDDFTSDEVQERYRAELGEQLSNFFDDVMSFSLINDMYGVPQSILDLIRTFRPSRDNGYSLYDNQNIIEMCVVDGKFSMNLFDHQFIYGPLVEVYPAEYATKAEYGRILKPDSVELLNNYQQGLINA